MREATELRRFEFVAMASQCELQLFGAEATVRRAAQHAIAEIRRIEAKYSRYRDDSVTTAINRAAGREAVAIDAETAALLDYGAVCHAMSDGAFDLTSGVLRRAWNFRGAPRVPTAGELDSVRARIGWHLVQRDAKSVFLPREGMELDFGGIGKEYAADRAAAQCAELEVVHGLVNLGGDVRVIGPRWDGTPWRIAVRHPREPGVAAAVPLSSGALATSGDYERYIEVDGVRYCHILDARTGMPVAGWQCVSVCAPVCTMAGSCATIAMLLGAQAPAFLAREGVDYLAFAADGTRCGTLAQTATFAHAG